MTNKEKMQAKINLLAKSFGATTGTIRTSLCGGKWRGTSDISIVFNNGVELPMGNELTPKAKTQKIQNGYLDKMLEQYSPEIVEARKAAAYSVLKRREEQDNAVAKAKGLKPYNLLSVEFCKGLEDSCWVGWYYVILVVDGQLHAHMETNLNYAITGGKVCEDTRANYFVAGGLEEKDVDFVFDNVGHSISKEIYTLKLDDETRQKAENLLAQCKN